MKNLFIPDYIYGDIYEINYGELKKKNIKVLIFDIDNTLVPYSEEFPNEQLERHLEEIKSAGGFEICFLSNNNDERVRSFNRNLQYPAYAKARKPLKKNMKKLLNSLNLKGHEAAVIGDQIFTDVLAANRMGMTSILVSPLGPDTSKIFKLKRALEKYFIKKYNKRNVSGGKKDKK